MKGNETREKEGKIIKVRGKTGELKVEGDIKGEGKEARIMRFLFFKFVIVILALKLKHLTLLQYQ